MQNSFGNAKCCKVRQPTKELKKKWMDEKSD